MDFGLRRNNKLETFLARKRYFAKASEYLKYKTAIAQLDALIHNGFANRSDCVK